VEYLSTFEIPGAAKSSKVAVELFQAATTYDMPNLQEKIVSMMLQRKDDWFDVNATLMLFLFIRKMKWAIYIKELRAKIGQVLKS